MICLKAEADKIERFIGLGNQASLNDASRWADSDDPKLRDFAVEVLAAIGTSEAQARLQKLGDDSFRSIAEKAKYSLKILAAGGSHTRWTLRIFRCLNFKPPNERSALKMRAMPIAQHASAARKTLGIVFSAVLLQGRISYTQ